jgi:hypothetical protein
MQWVVCWLVFMCGMIMHAMATTYQTMKDYMDFIKELHEIYGHKCWAIIYQADARMRRTGVEGIRRAADRLLQQTINAEKNGQRLYILGPGNPYDFDPLNPWDYCYRMAIGENSLIARKYWKKYVETPCNAVLRGESVDKYLDEDCRIAPTLEEHIATGGLAFNNPGLMGNQLHTNVPSKIKVKGPGTPGGPAPKGTKKDSKQDANGIWTHNVKGVRICAGYNASTCKGQCPKNEAHQCNKCLQNSHPATRCGEGPVKTEKERHRHRSNGKAKGKGKIR